MSIVIETKLLKKALALAKKGIAKKSTLPVLKMVRLQVVDGKLENAGLGEFCCSSRNLRTRDLVLPVPVP